MIRIGLIGLGGIMRGVHIPGILASSDMTIAAVCDCDSIALRTVGDQLSIPDNRRFLNYKDLIACPDVDAVDIATPNDVHVPIALFAVGEKKPYSCEKPLALCEADAKLLEEQTKKAGLPSMVCFSYRFKAAARYARDIVLRGEIGDVLHVAFQYFQSWGLPDAGCPLVWRYIKARTGTGALGDLGSHAVDLVSFVTGLRYRKVAGQCGTFVKERRLPEGNGFGSVDVDDYSNSLAFLENGATCTFQITRFAFGRGNYQRMEIYGTKGALIYTLDEAGTGADAVSICEGKAMGETYAYHELPIPGKYRASQMQSFADLLKGSGDGLTASVEDGAYNMKIMDAIDTSCKNSSWIEL